MATSQFPDVGVSSILPNMTTIAPVLTTGQGVPAIVRAILLIPMAVFNLIGNGFTLATIRQTPRLWTKTNFILASMLVANLMSGLFMFWYIPFLVVVYVFNDHCHYNVLRAVLTFVVKTPGLVSVYHLVLISIERFIAIVFPLHYETKFTDRTLKWSVSACWVCGMVLQFSFAFWLIDADLGNCDLIPPQYYLIEVVLAYVSVSVCLFTLYGKILAVSWRHRQRVEPGSVGPVSTEAAAAAKTTPDMTLPPTLSTEATDSDNTVAQTRPSADTTASVESSQGQAIKSRRREFKAAYLTASIVGAFVILWFTYMLSNVLAAVSYNPAIVSYMHQAGGALGTFNYAFAWALYAAVSKSYRRAYRQMFIRIGFCKNLTPQADNSLIV